MEATSLTASMHDIYLPHSAAVHTELLYMMLIALCRGIDACRKVTAVLHQTGDM